MSDFDITRPLPEGITLVEASAGTGKTHNITGLVVRLVVEHGLRIDQILVVTFTRAATAELRGRVRARLRQTLETYDRALADPGYHPDEDDELLVYLLQRSREGGSLQADRNRARGAVDEFDQAAISTIHGFCQRMLHHNAFESGVEFGAELMEDVQPLVEEVVQDYWTRRIHDVSTPVLAHLAERKIGLDDLLDLSRKALATPDLTLIPDPPEVDTGRLEEQIRRWPEAANALARQWTDDRAMAVGQIRNALKKRALDGRVIRRDWFDPALKAMDQWLSTCPNPARPAPAGLRYFTRGLLEEAWARARRRRTRPRGYRLVPRPAHPVFDLAQELLDRQNVLAVELDAFALSLKYGLARTVRAQLTTRKRAGNALSFDDLLVDLRDGLHDPERGEHLRRAIRQQYHAALIDEFQDTDPVQWEIFREVFGGGHRRLLLIGDPKQAIYAFRGADIFTYQSARESANEEHGLPENWRSDKPYVDAVNHLFDEKGCGGPSSSTGSATIRCLPTTSNPACPSPTGREATRRCLRCAYAWWAEKEPIWPKMDGASPRRGPTTTSRPLWPPTYRSYLPAGFGSSAREAWTQTSGPGTWLCWCAPTSRVGGCRVCCESWGSTAPSTARTACCIASSAWSWSGCWPR